MAAGGPVLRDVVSARVSDTLSPFPPVPPPEKRRGKTHLKTRLLHLPIPPQPLYQLLPPPLPPKHPPRHPPLAQQHVPRPTQPLPRRPPTHHPNRRRMRRVYLFTHRRVRRELPQAGRLRSRRPEGVEGLGGGEVKEGGDGSGGTEGACCAGCVEYAVVPGEVGRGIRRREWEEGAEGPTQRSPEHLAGAACNLVSHHTGEDKVFS